MTVPSSPLRTKDVLLSVILVILALAITFAVLVGAYVLLWRYAILKPEMALPMLLLAGVVLFVGSLALLAAAFKALDLQDTNHALALPEGSIRAILALMLVFLFFVAAIFLFAGSQGPDRHLHGLTPDQFGQLPLVDLVGSTPRPTATPTAYDVVLRSNVPEATKDIANNLIVLLGTLLTAIAAFYFGTKAGGPGRQEGTNK